jgi:hypothetical protein
LSWYVRTDWTFQSTRPHKEGAQQQGQTTAVCPDITTLKKQPIALSRCRGKTFFALAGIAKPVPGRKMFRPYLLAALTTLTTHAAAQSGYPQGDPYMPFARVPGARHNRSLAR